MDLTIEQALQKAVEAHKAGQIQEADRLYTAILKAQPKHPDANHNLGVLAVSVGKAREALPFFKAALEANPSVAQFWLSYIEALIKLEKLEDAKSVLNQAKGKGAKGDGFDKLERRLQKATQLSLKANQIATEPQPKQPNILDSLKLDQALKLAKKKEKAGLTIEAKSIYRDILTKFPKNTKAVEGLKTLQTKKSMGASHVEDPPQDQVQSLIDHYNKAQLQQALQQADFLIQKFPKSALLYNILGAVLKGLGQLDSSVEAYKKALAIKPDYAEAYNNMGVSLRERGTLEEALEAHKKALDIQPDYADAYYNMGNAIKEQGRLKEAIDAYKKALDIQPDYADAYNNIGNALKDQGKLDEAIQAFNNALATKPDYADAYYNMGATLQEQGKLEEAIEAYKKALAIKRDYADAYNNMGTTLQEQGKLEEAIEAYKKALAIKPDYAEAHRNLSILTKYNSNTAQISTVVALLERTDLNNSDRCNLLYTHAKMQEDMGDLRSAFESYVAGGDLRKKLLAYEPVQDQRLFARIKKTAPHFKDLAQSITSGSISHTPIFILGMPRSGTTLVEQIISSHSKVTGAGELGYVSQFGGQIASDLKAPTSEALATFRDRYLKELAKRASDQAFVTDKMPQNFRYIALICAALPEAKIIHVQRNSKATCWSNFKHYFTSKDLGYSYNLGDTVKYHELYKDLMHFWFQSYNDRIYNLDYDKLTEDRELGIRRLIEYLGLKWEDSCLAPQENKRSVKTASSQQVRQKVYTGSSQAWRKYEPFLNGNFEQLED